MKTLIVVWLISAVSLLIVGHIIPGFEVQSFGSALIAAVVIGLINALMSTLTVLKNHYNPAFNSNIWHIPSGY